MKKLISAKIISALMTISVLIPETRAADTTFSETRIVPKHGSESGSTTHFTEPEDASSHRDEDSRHEGYLSLESETPATQGFYGSCMDSQPEEQTFKEAVASLLLFPLKAGFCGLISGFGESHVHLFMGHGNMAAWPRNDWRFGLGFGFGAGFLPGLAGGVTTDLHLEADKNLSGLSAPGMLRLRAAAFGTAMEPAADYARTVLVDGKPIGIQGDQMDTYSQSGQVVSADWLWLPGNRGFYLGGGLGAIRLREYIGYIRHTDYARLNDSLTEARRQILPTLGLSVGRYGGGHWISSSSSGPDKVFWSFEFRYQAIFHDPRHLTSYPGDNGYLTHQIAWEWSWLW